MKAKKTRKISFVNPKGGAGKTVSAVNTAYGLVNRGYRTLLIDSDPRGAIQVYLGLESENTLYELIKDKYENYTAKINLNDYIVTKNGLDILISDDKLTQLEKIFKGDIENELSCIADINYLFDDYDFVVFDTEGTINNMTRAILKVTDYIFTPTQASNIDVNGIRDLLNIFELAQRRNPSLEVKKIFLVRAKHQTNAYKSFSEQLKSFFDENQFSEVAIRENQDIINAMSEQLDIFSYKKSSNGAIDYKNLVDEFLEELEEPELAEEV